MKQLNTDGRTGDLSGVGKTERNVQGMTAGWDMEFRRGMGTVPAGSGADEPVKKTVWEQ
ncbi:MAG TPA: hypothetical protein VLN47_07400 [Clostridiaceae bacterium]|nr:hypothetical protein [Clostridiaceae bacterium]